MLDFFQMTLSSFWSFSGVMLVLLGFAVAAEHVINAITNGIVNIVEISRR